MESKRGAVGTDARVVRTATRVSAVMVAVCVVCVAYGVLMGAPSEHVLPAGMDWQRHGTAARRLSAEEIRMRHMRVPAGAGAGAAGAAAAAAAPAEAEEEGAAPARAGGAPSVP